MVTQAEEAHGGSLDVSNFEAIAALVIFALCILGVLVLVFRPTRITIRRLTITLPYYLVPVVAVLLMLACQSMSIQDVGNGLKGNDQIKPYGILILFMSMAYIAASLDASGVFAWLALKITYASRGHGMALFFFYFSLSSVMTTFTSNDVCILTLTPIISYFSKATGVDPMPFQFAEYAAANIFGMTLYTGNPTNIIVADAYDMTFLGYSKYMTLPALAAGAAGLSILLIMFRHQVPKTITLPVLDAALLLRDRLGAVVGSVNMLTCLALLAAAPSLGWEMWAITLVCAGVHLVYNTWPLLLRPRLAAAKAPVSASAAGGGKASAGGGAAAATAGDGSCEEEHLPEGAAAPEEVQMSLSPAGGKALAACGSSDAQPPQPPAPGRVRSKPALPAQALRGDDPAAAAAHSPRAVPSLVAGDSSSTSDAGGDGPAAAAVLGRGDDASVSSTAPPKQKLPNHDQQQPAEGPADADGSPAVVAAVAAVAAPESVQEEAVAALGPQHASFVGLLWGLPWEVVPFALGMFVMVEGLYVNNWLNVFGDGLGAASTTLPGAIFLMGGVSVLLANTINNQPMTILLTRVALNERYIAHVGTGATHKAALFALVAGSNVGAVFTLIGALAGILWSNLLKLQGIHVTYVQFLKAASPVGFLALVASLFVLWFEFAVFP